MRARCSRRRLAGSPKSCTASGGGSGSTPTRRARASACPRWSIRSNPGLTGGVQNQPDFQAGCADHRTHFANEVPRFVREAMREYGELTGRSYSPVKTFMCDDAETVMIGLGSVTDDAEAVATYLRSQGKKVGVVSVKLLQPFPEAELVAALKGKKAVTVLERSDVTALTSMVTQALFKARENAERRAPCRHSGDRRRCRKITTAIFGLGAHDLQPRHLIAAFKNMDNRRARRSSISARSSSPRRPRRGLRELQAKLKAAYPETELMALETEANPHLLPAVGVPRPLPFGGRLRHHRHRQAADRHPRRRARTALEGGAEIRLGEERRADQLLHHAEPRAGEDHQRRARRRRNRRSRRTTRCSATPIRCAVWSRAAPSSCNRTFRRSKFGSELPAQARKTIRDKKINFFVIDAFAVAKRHAPTPELETRMMGIAFIGAVCGHVDRVTAGASQDAMLEEDPPADHQEVRRQGRRASSKATWR